MNYFKERFNYYSKKRIECSRELKVLNKLPVSYWFGFILIALNFICYDLQNCFNVKLISFGVFNALSIFYCFYCLFIFILIQVNTRLEKRFLNRRIEYFNLYINSKNNKSCVRALNSKSNKV